MNRALEGVLLGLLTRLRKAFKLIVVPAPHLAPLEHVRRDSANSAEWVCEGEQARFLLNKSLPIPGWHMLEVAIEHAEGAKSLRLCLDTGNGWDEGSCINLPLKARRVSKRLCFLPFGLKAIRVELDVPTGKFQFSHFRIVWLPTRFARDRMAQRLANMHFRWRDAPRGKVLQDLKMDAQENGQSWREAALKAYDETFTHRPPRRSYLQWLENVEGVRELGPEKVLRVLSKLPYKPLISVVVPVHNTRVEWLCECIESVLAQSYAYWQLCIADDASSNPEIREVLSRYAANDARIEVVYRESNGHICAASNSALELVKGECVALLDHDDRLAPNALFHVIEALHRHPDAAVLYSDEDKIDAQGVRFDPHFKPEWNPDLILSQNYVSHLGVYRADLLRAIGGFREGFEGSQDHDLLLRCVARVRPDQIVHIPHILYHWRAAQGSTALSSEEKSYTSSSGQRAVQDFLDSQGVFARVRAGRFPNTYCIHWSLPEPAPLVSLMVPTRDGVDVLQPCVDAILQRTDYPNFELLVLDNQSRCSRTLEYMDRLQEDSRVRILRWDHPFNYSAINNFGAGQARGSILGLINNDVEPINPDWLCEMVRHVSRAEIGCVGAKLYYPNDTIQHGGVILGIGGVAGHAHKHFSRNHPGYFTRLHLVQNLSAVTGACLLVRKDVFDEVGGLDEEHLAVAFNDVDLCLKVREAGYRNLWTPYAELYHHESVSRGADDTNKKRLRAQGEAQYMRSRWGKALDRDPAYNPNLTLVHEDFSLR